MATGISELSQGLKTLTLTFDDGPDGDRTQQVLGALQAENVVATFFMVGERVLAQPGLARSVLARGHDVQLHCHRHVRHSTMTAAEIDADAAAGIRALRSISVRPRLWRPPWGVCTADSVLVAKSRRLRLTRWDVDTHDWRGDPAASMLDDAKPRIRDGGVVLMHDGIGPGARRDDCRNTVELISALVQTARRQGLRLAPMRDGSTDG